MDGRTVTELVPGSFIMVRIEPGQHDIWAYKEKYFHDKKRYLQLKAEKGRLYFIRQEVTFRDMKLDLMDAASGRAGVEACRLLVEKPVTTPQMFR